MTTTLDLNERLVKKAQKLTGISEESKMLNEVLKTYVNAEEFAREMLPLQDSDIWEGEPEQEPK
jgi:Arc/MetJ family transcription regulator